MLYGLDEGHFAFALDSKDVISNVINFYRCTILYVFYRS